MIIANFMTLIYINDSYNLKIKQDFFWLSDSAVLILSLDTQLEAK